MRADRLISLLMLLQKNSRMKAGDLARELEVSVRTIYRDVDSLSFSGVPIFCERGPGGGIELLEHYRSDLTGLNRNEVRALFMMGIPAPIVDLGMDDEMKRALRKLAASLPSGMAAAEERSRRFFIDAEPWDDNVEAPTPILRIIKEAIWDERPLMITHRSTLGASTGLLKSKIEPYGLVAKDGQWFLVGCREDHITVVIVGNIVAVEIDRAINFNYPANFSLTTFWAGWIKNRKANRPSFMAIVDVAPEVIPYFTPNILSEIETPDNQGEGKKWTRLQLQFPSLFEARNSILIFGGGIMVVEPTALRLSVCDFAQQTSSLYADSSSNLAINHPECC